MLTEMDKRWHAVYEAANEQTRGAIDEAFSIAVRTLEQHGIPLLWSDDAEALVAALTRYTVACRAVTAIDQANSESLDAACERG